MVLIRKTGKLWLTIVLRTITVCCLLVAGIILGLNVINPFSYDIIKLRSFYYQSVDGRLFNAYFKPFGAYGGGMGTFWITETPCYFPLIEWSVYENNTVHHDFSDDMFEGQPIDNYKVVGAYIRKEVIEKGK